MSFLEVIALDRADALAAASGGADRIELLGSMTDGGMSPEPALVEQVVAEVGIPVRPMVRLRPGFGTDGAEVTRMRGLVASYLNAGADGVVLGFLDASGRLDVEVIRAIIEDQFCRWTLHRAIDHAADYEQAWQEAIGLPGLDQVLTAGSARGLDAGMDRLLAAASDPNIARLAMAGGGLDAEQVPWLVRGGITAFHIGRLARPDHDMASSVDPGLVEAFGQLIEHAINMFHRP